MANIMDYMDWRGDLSFEADEFNEVDNLILAQLAYVDFEGIVTAEENAPAVPLKEASGQFWEKNDKDEILARVSMTKSAPFVMEKMAETKRFSDVKLRCYVNEIRDEEQFQFSAVCVELPDVYIRATMATMIRLQLPPATDITPVKNLSIYCVMQLKDMCV